MSKNEEILVLGINGRKKALEYQKTLYEAAVLGISRVMFVVVLDDSEKHDKNINAMSKTILETCKILNIEPISTKVTLYGGGSFITSVGTVNEKCTIPRVSGIPRFSSYKRRKENSDKLATAEDFEEVYEKKLKRA